MSVNGVLNVDGNFGGGLINKVMTVIRPNSISGVSSITGNAGGDISIFRADGTAADVTVNNITSGVITATNFSGNITGTTASFTGDVGIGGTLTYEDVTNIDSVGIITARAGINVTGGNVTVGGKLLATTGKAIAMAMVFDK